MSTQPAMSTLEAPRVCEALNLDPDGDYLFFASSDYIPERLAFRLGKTIQSLGFKFQIHGVLVEKSDSLQASSHNVGQWDQVPVAALTSARDERASMEATALFIVQPGALISESTFEAWRWYRATLVTSKQGVERAPWEVH